MSDTELMAAREEIDRLRADVARLASRCDTCVQSREYAKLQVEVARLREACRVASVGIRNELNRCCGTDRDPSMCELECIDNGLVAAIAGRGGEA